MGKKKVSLTALEKQSSIKLIGRLPRTSEELKELRTYIKSPVGSWLKQRKSKRRK